jgi:preprotein translocase subunit SecG
MGVKKGTEFIEKATWGLAITLILLSVLMSPQGTTTVSDDEGGSVAKRKAQSAVAAPMQQSAPMQQQAPATPANPADQQPQ